MGLSRSEETFLCLTLKYFIMKLFKLLFMFVVLAGFAGCTNGFDELVDDGSGLSCSARAVSYQINGPAILNTYADYSVVATDGSALPSGLTVTWDYPSDFYRIGYTNTTITLGRKMAVGTYTLTARLSNGYNVSKQIVAQEEPITPPASNPSLEFRSSMVATSLTGVYESIDKYLLMSTGHYLVSEKIFLKIGVTNNTTSSIQLSSSKLKVSYGNSNARYNVNARDANLNNFTSITVPAKSTISLYIELLGDWMNNRILVNLPGDPINYYVTNLHFADDGHNINTVQHNFLFSTHSEQNRN